jgi:hypothetical protein
MCRADRLLTSEVKSNKVLRVSEQALLKAAGMPLVPADKRVASVHTVEVANS